MQSIYMVRPKEKLGALLRDAGEIFTVSTAAASLGTSNVEAAKILARWATQGWLARIRRGLYAMVPIEAVDTQQALDDEWMIIPKLFSPCYIGGWSAAEYWDLTEQVFRDTCIMTEKYIGHKQQKFHNVSFELSHIPPTLNFATKTIWKNRESIKVSDPHKTIIDILNMPHIGGGIQHVTACFCEYIKSQYFDSNKLADYALRINNGAVFKRLGFLTSELMGAEHPLTLLCREHLTKGLAYIDPSIKDGKLITNWRLFVPDDFRI
ncbi:MAG: hypothetical protein K0R73_1379 [Candidatus Midichloriaceae bacterium]|jgi:predicted transcriptional regulator of viral defense system|nr:hypothetical protein [Candidatus Midichloriaceae bacterium]